VAGRSFWTASCVAGAAGGTVIAANLAGAASRVAASAGDLTGGASRVAVSAGEAALPDGLAIGASGVASPVKAPPMPVD